MTHASAAPSVSSLQFFSHLKWLDGRPLLDTIEEYRRELFRRALDERRPDGSPRFNLVLSGRAKKNHKTTDLGLAGLFCLVIRENVRGTDGYILANDEDQAGDDLDLVKKLVAANPNLSAELEPLQKEIRRRDGGGVLQILPARDAIGAHGKTAQYIAFDEIHGYRNYDLLEALAPDPTRADTLTWITSYDCIFTAPGVPLVDLKRIGREGSDPRMLFSWYSGDYCTDPAFAGLEPEVRANPGIGSWPEGRAYLDQQRRRLPTHKFRRLHLNMPGAPNGAFLDQGKVMDAVVEKGRQRLPPTIGIDYRAFVDMSGGSNDDACLGIAHRSDEGKAVLDVVMKQAGSAPFNPRDAVARFAGVMQQFGISTVVGDAYAGETFRADFAAHNITYWQSERTKTQIFEAFEPALNASDCEILDVPILLEQMLTLVVKGARIEAEGNGHDDWPNAACGAIVEVLFARAFEREFNFTGIQMGPRRDSFLQTLY